MLEAKASSEIARPVVSEMTFLSWPFLSRGRKAFVVSTGPTTWVENEVVRSSVKMSGEGLWKEVH